MINMVDVKKVSAAASKAAGEFVPQGKPKGEQSSKTTKRDVGNIALLVIPLTGFLTWFLVDIAHFTVVMPKETVGMLAGVVAYFVARKFRY
jgi:hypothetical protein